MLTRQTDQSVGLTRELTLPVPYRLEPLALFTYINKKTCNQRPGPLLILTVKKANKKV